MTKNRADLLKSIYRICFSVLTGIVGLLFIAQAWSIYASAPQNAYTTANISKHFLQILAPVILWGIALVGNIVLGFVFPDAPEKATAYLSGSVKLARMEKRLPEELKGKTDVCKVLLILVWSACAVFFVAAMAVSLAYLFDKTYAPMMGSLFFTEHGAVADRLFRILPWLLAAMLLVCLCGAYEYFYYTRGLSRAKTALAQAAKEKKLQPVTETPLRGFAAFKAKMEAFIEKPAVVWSMRGVLLAVGVTFFIWGIVNGGMISVLEKAINICTQCIGLG